MTGTETRDEFRALSPEVRRAVAAKAGHFRNHFEESLRAAQRHSEADGVERYQSERRRLGVSRGNDDGEILAEWEQGLPTEIEAA